METSGQLYEASGANCVAAAAWNEPDDEIDKLYEEKHLRKLHLSPELCEARTTDVTYMDMNPNFESLSNKAIPSA